MSNNKSSGKFAIAALVLALVALTNDLIIFSQRSIASLYASYDTGWIIRTGEFIVRNQALPATNIFSWAEPERTFVTYQWLFEVLAALIYQTGGLWLVGLVSCLSAGVLFFYLLPRSWIIRGIPPFVPFLVLTLLLSPHWFNLRPQLISNYLLFFLPVILEAHREHRGPKWLVWLIPVLFVFWSNVHLFWSIGLILLAFYALCELLRVKGDRPSQFADLTLPGVLVASAVCVLVNPYGAQLYAYMMSFTNASQWMGMREVQSAFTALTEPRTLRFLTYLVLCWAALLWKRQSVCMEGFLICAAATVASLLVRRYESVAILVTWIYFGMALQGINWERWRYSWVPPKWQGTPVNATALALVVVAVTVIWYRNAPSESAAMDLYFESSTPTLQFAAAHIGDGARLFNDPSTGSMLVLLTGKPVYVDTRYDVYSKAFVDDCMNCLTPVSDWAEKLRKKNVERILVRNDYFNFKKALMTSEAWLPVIDDGIARGGVSLWIPNDTKSAALLDRWNVSDDKVKNSELPKELIRATINTRAEHYFNLHKIHAARNEPQKAIEDLQKGLALLPGNTSLQKALDKITKAVPQ